MAGAAWVAALGHRAALALESADAVFASAFFAPDGSYGVATLTEAGMSTGPEIAASGSDARPNLRHARPHLNVATRIGEVVDVCDLR